MNPKQSPKQKPVKQDLGSAERSTPVKMDRDSRTGIHVSKQKGQRDLRKKIKDGLSQYEIEDEEDHLPNSVSSN